jgi:hypothetical protein
MVASLAKGKIFNTEDTEEYGVKPNQDRMEFTVVARPEYGTPNLGLVGDSGHQCPILYHRLHSLMGAAWMFI